MILKMVDEWISVMTFFGVWLWENIKTEMEKPKIWKLRMKEAKAKSKWKITTAKCKLDDGMSNFHTFWQWRIAIDYCLICSRKLSESLNGLEMIYACTNSHPFLTSNIQH